MEKNCSPSVLCVPLGAGISTGISKFGGLPDVPANFIWPVWRDESLLFLAQINLREVSCAYENRDLPDSGLLYFFCAKGEQTWGFDPSDKGSWSVMYCSSVKGLAKAELPDDLHSDYLFNEIFMKFQKVNSHPYFESPMVKKMSLKKIDEYYSLTVGEKPVHKLFGYPDAVLEQMQLDCQLTSNGISTGTETGYRHPGARKLSAGASQWKLLMQFDNDKDLGMLWSNLGKLTFWYKSCPSGVDFDKTWMIFKD